MRDVIVDEHFGPGVGVREEFWRCNVAEIANETRPEQVDQRQDIAILSCSHEGFQPSEDQSVVIMPTGWILPPSFIHSASVHIRRIYLNTHHRSVLRHSSSSYAVSSHSSNVFASARLCRSLPCGHLDLHHDSSRCGETVLEEANNSINDDTHLLPEECNVEQDARNRHQHPPKTYL